MLSALFSEINAHPTSNQYDYGKATVKVRLAQAVADTRQAAKAISDAKPRLEAVSNRVSP